MEHLPDVPNPSPLVPLLVQTLPTRFEAEKFITDESTEWNENPSIAALEAQKCLYFGLLVCFSDCELNLNLYIHDDMAFLNSHFNQYALGRRWLRKPSHDMTARLLLASRMKTSILCKIFPLTQLQPDSEPSRDYRDIHLICLSINLLIEHIQTALSSTGCLVSPNIARRVLEMIPEWYDERYLLAPRVRTALTDLSILHWDVFMAITPPGGQIEGQRDALHGGMRYSDSEHGKFLKELLFPGWCPSFVEFTFANLSWSTCVYLSTIKHPGIAHNQMKVEGANRCTSQRCWFQIDEENYQTKHTVDGCICAFLGPSSRMKDIVRQGGTPLLRLTYDRNGRTSLNIEEATTASKYIAISHVWSGGLGNPGGNQLPICQLRQLAGNLDKVSRMIGPAMFNLQKRLSSQTSPLFWMDTLCIPVRDHTGGHAQETDQSREIRQRAINSMQEIYMGAMAVLVIDSGLQQLDSSVSRHQIYGHILTSSWMSRCWTFEEASMAAEVFVLLKDRPYRLKMHQLTRRDKVLEFHETLSGHLQKQMMSWTNDLPLAGGDIITPGSKGTGRETVTMAYPWTFIRLYNTVLRRATSRESDRLIILSTMLNFRPIDLVNLAPEQRLSRIVGSMKYLPQSLLYMDHEPGLPCDAARSWLPMTRMIEHIPPERPHSDCLKREGNGRWRLRLDKNINQCIFVLLALDLEYNDILVTMGQRLYYLELWDRNLETTEGVRSFCPPVESCGIGRRFVVLVQDRHWLLNTTAGGTTACALFELDRDSPFDPDGGWWKVSYIMGLKCSLKAADSSSKSQTFGTIIRDNLETLSSPWIILTFPVPDCKQ